jgi:hypothetical protein
MENTVQPEYIDRNSIPQTSQPVKSSNLSIIILSIFVVVCLATICYLFWQNQQLKVSLNQVPSVPSNPQVEIKPEPEFVPLVTVTIPENWKTYVNKKCGYEVKYPPTWKLLPEPETAVYGAAVIYPSEVGSGIKPPAEWVKLQIGCADRTAGSTPESIIAQLNSRDTGNSGESKFGILEKTAVNGSLAYMQTLEPAFGENVLEYFVFPAGSKYYDLGFTPAENNQMVRNQILSTVKFTVQ